MREAVQRIYRERKALVAGLKVLFFERFRFSFLTMLLGCGQRRLETRRNPCCSRPLLLSVHMSVDIQQARHTRIPRASIESHCRLLLHFWPLSSDAV